jgi:hypothetical protein
MPLLGCVPLVIAMDGYAEGLLGKEMTDFESKKLDPTDPYSDLQDMSRQQLMGQILRYRKYIDILEERYSIALQLHSALNFDIDRELAIRLMENSSEYYKAYCRETKTNRKNQSN